MSIYKYVGQQLKEVGATDGRSSHLAFVYLSLGWKYYNKYIEQLREKKAKEEAKRNA